MLTNKMLDINYITEDIILDKLLFLLIYKKPRDEVDEWTKAFKNIENILKVYLYIYG